MPVSADTLAVLIAKGISGDDLVEVVRAIDADAGLPVASNASVPASVERRRAFDRERQANRRAAEKADKAAREVDVHADVHVDRPVDGPSPAAPQRDIIKPPTTLSRSSLRSESVKTAERAFDEDFWPVYPRRVAKDAARKAFIAKVAGGRTTVETIVAGARALAARSVGKDLAFVPHAATWLNAGGFDDEEPQVGGSPARPTTSGVKTTSGVWLHRDDPRFQVWAAYKKSIGKTQAVDGNGGWTFPTEAPPAQQPSAATAKQLELH